MDTFRHENPENVGENLFEWPSVLTALPPPAGEEGYEHQVSSAFSKVSFS